MISRCSLRFAQPVLALGAQQKGRFCLARGKEVFLSPDFGDLALVENFLSYQSCLKRALRDFKFRPRIIAHDLHPDYATSRWVCRFGQVRFPEAAIVPVQHHHAHIASVLGEKGIPGPVIGIAWDGAGYGPGGAVWGGEFLLAAAGSFERRAHFEYVPMPGGEKAVEEPWRMAAAVIHHCLGEAGLRALPAIPGFTPKKLPKLLSLIERRLNSPPTSSVGRLFDAAAAILRLVSGRTGPAEAAIALETAAKGKIGRAYPFRLNRRKRPYVIQIKELFRGIITDLGKRTAREEIAARFHGTLVEIGAETAAVIARETGVRDVVLSGGVFQNRIIREGLRERLKAKGLTPSLPEKVPFHDGGIALGQAIVAGASS